VADVVAGLARLRVPLGFATGVVVLLLATPTWTALAAGTAAVFAGEALRIWAAGHLEKSREVTCSGPYRWFRHPLYVGSSIMAVGVCIAGVSLIAAALILVYMAATLHAATRTEEAFLRRKFGSEYEEYCRGQGGTSDRPFSWSRVLRNREYRAVAGIAVVFAILALKAAFLPGR
jgi:protein-S-isoprenylcysteine O-methyltransferase Ste14